MLIKNLFVLSDASCELCKRCKKWLNGQHQLVRLTFIEAGSDEARRMFPVLNHHKTLEELTVVSDTGAVYTGEKAWVMCLWALADYRGWACTLSNPTRLHIAKAFINVISNNRKAISRFIAPQCEGC